MQNTGNTIVFTPQVIDDLNIKNWAIIGNGAHYPLENFDAVILAASDISYSIGLADAYLNKGWALYYRSSYKDAFELFNKALKIYRNEEDFNKECKALNAVGEYYYSVGRFDKAFEYYKQALDIANLYKYEDRIMATKNSIAELYLELDNPKLAMTYLLPTYFNLKGNMDSYPTDGLRNIGSAYLQLGNNDLAEVFSKKAYDKSITNGEMNIAAETLEVLAQIALDEKDYDKADKLTDEGLLISSKTDNQYLQIGHMCIRATILNKNKMPKDALVILKKAENICEEKAIRTKLYKIYELQSEAYAMQGKYKEALKYYKSYSTQKSEIQNEDTATKLHNLQALAEIERVRQNEEILRNKNIELQNKTNELKAINKQITLVSQLGKKIAASFGFNDIVDTVYSCIQPLFNMDLFGIALPDTTKTYLVYKYYYEDNEKKQNWKIKLDSEVSFAIWTYKNRKPILISEKSTESNKYLEKPAKLIHRPTESIACIPLFLDNRSIGIIMMQNYKSNAYAPEDLEFLKALSPYVSIAIENMLIHERLENLNKDLSSEKQRLEKATLRISHLANHDSLTGLPNRRLLFELLGKALERAKRSNSMIGIIYMDLDRFKPINDLFGHAAGDVVLTGVADRIKKAVRASDIVARLGGDEFIAVIDNVNSRENVESVAKKIEKECEVPFVIGEEECSIGMSLGIAMYPEDGVAIDNLINRADSVMYTHKNCER